MNKNFADWYRVANMQPIGDQLDNRWSGISEFIQSNMDKDDIFELVRMFNQQSTQEEFNERYVGCFMNYDSAFDRNNKLELSVLAGATLVEIVESNKYKMLAIFATISSSFIKNSPVILDIIEKIRESFAKETCSIRENIMLQDDVIYEHSHFNVLYKLLSQPVGWSEDFRKYLYNYIGETYKNLESLFEKEQQHRKINNVYAEDSQILWWLTGEWSNDLERPFSQIKQCDAILYIGKELADKIETLPGPYSAKAVIHKMLECCNKRNKCQTITLKDAVEKSDVRWRKKCLKQYDASVLREITPIMFAISESLTVEEGEDWNPQFRKVVRCGADEIEKTVEKMAFQVYLECLTIKCYNIIEE